MSSKSAVIGVGQTPLRFQTPTKTWEELEQPAESEALLKQFFEAYDALEAHPVRRYGHCILIRWSEPQWNGTNHRHIEKLSALILGKPIFDLPFEYDPMLQS